MYCKKCGNLLESNDVFCKNCGEKVRKDDMPQVKTSTELNQQVKSETSFNSNGQNFNFQQQIEANQISNEQIKKKNNLSIIIIIVAVLTVFGFGIVVLSRFINNGINTKSSSLISNTKWKASDGSEVVFTSDRINWYRYSYDHSDNYYSGTYSFHIGKDAVDYITKNLSQYGVTKNELQSLFNRNTTYSEDNFVVFDIRYDKYVVNKKNQTITRPVVPWYGFILNENTYLDVVNMNTSSYYKFTKE